ncbi:MAG: hypothetical protein LJF30_15170 [Acidobacteria bacterium]|nr:hypothetical protein [Acidobacteriota bacterium]
MGPNRHDCPRTLAPVFIPAVLSFLLPAHPVTAQDGPLWPDHEEIEHFLKKAEITQRVEIGTGVTRPERVTLEQDGVVRQACFKRIDVMQQDSWRSEVAAYELDKLLGMGMVPPTVERSIGGRKGCLQLWVTGATMEAFEGTPPDLEDWRDQVSVMWLFDDLIANSDRHLNNAIVSPEGRLILIDNSKTFRNDEHLRNDLNARGAGTHARFWGVEFDESRERYPTRYPPDLVERLRSLSDEEIKRAIKRYVWGWRASLVVKRRELILERLDSMGEELSVALEPWR